MTLFWKCFFFFFLRAGLSPYTQVLFWVGFQRTWPVLLSYMPATDVHVIMVVCFLFFTHHSQMKLLIRATSCVHSVLFWSRLTFACEFLSFSLFGIHLLCIRLLIFTVHTARKIMNVAICCGNGVFWLISKEFSKPSEKRMLNFGMKTLIFSAVWWLPQLVDCGIATLAMLCATLNDTDGRCVRVCGVMWFGTLHVSVSSHQQRAITVQSKTRCWILILL